MVQESFESWMELLGGCLVIGVLGVIASIIEEKRRRPKMERSIIEHRRRRSIIEQMRRHSR